MRRRRLVLSVGAQGLESAWAFLNSLAAFEMSYWLGAGIEVWALLAAVACWLALRRPRVGFLLSAGLQAMVVALGVILLVVARDVPLMGGAHLLVGGMLLAAFVAEWRASRV